MQVVFVHQNFPAQFRCIAPWLASEAGWRCAAVSCNPQRPTSPGVERVLYRIRAYNGSCSSLVQRFENALAHANGVYNAMRSRPDLQPDLVVAHSGFGSSLFLPQLYDSPIINFFEYFHRSTNKCVGYRPELDLTESKLLRVPVANAMVLLDLNNCDQGWCPNHAQKSVFPAEYHHKLEVLPEGIDTILYRRSTEAPRKLPNGVEIGSDIRIVTYVARGLELTRGFDLFMKAAKLIAQRMSNVIFVIVGEDRAYYGSDAELTDGRTLREHVLASDDYDLSRFHFTGRVPEKTLADILSISDLHFYLTVPFVTSWSMLDAMSTSCVVLASDQACTREYIRHGENGLLCDFFDVEGMAEQAVKVLQDSAAHRPLGEAARRTIEEQYSLDVCLPKIKSFFERVAAKKRTPSVRAELLVREGTGLPPIRIVEAPEVVDTRPAFEGVVPFYADGRAVADAASTSRARRQTVPCETEKLLADARGSLKRRNRTILFAWELGAGLGHLLPMLPIIEELNRRGHHVYLALHDLSRAAEIFGQANVRLLQAPAKTGGALYFPQTVTHAHLLANIGWGDDGELFSLCCAWRHLYQYVEPDLILFDHSPTAMLAARGCEGTRKAIVGTGFFIPPDATPWPAMGGKLDDEKRVAEDEALVLEIANRTLERLGAAPMERLGQLYSHVDETFLATFPELDHYAAHRPADAKYWGPIHHLGGRKPEWPDAQGPKVYAYLKSFPTLPHVLAALRRLGGPTLVLADGIDLNLRKRFESPSLRFVDERLDLEEVGRTCDVAIHNANHGTLCELLRAGRPTLQIPITREQAMLARQAEAAGAVATLATRRIQSAKQVERAIQALLNMPGRNCFAARYASFDPAEQQAGTVDRLEQLLAAGDEEAAESQAEEVFELAAV